MSWLPIINSLITLVFIPSIFIWQLKFYYVSLFCGVFCLLYLVEEVFVLKDRRPSAFLLFIMSEAIIFITLFVSTLWLMGGFVRPISDAFGLPFLGCFLLIGSSISATAFHHSSDFLYRKYFLILTIFLGFCFLVLQMFEFYFCKCDLFFSSYYASAFCTTGLHFLHVVLGLVFLSYIFFMGADDFNRYFVDLAVWYWHFVDYIWLLVFLVVYIV